MLNNYSPLVAKMLFGVTAQLCTKNTHFVPGDDNLYLIPNNSLIFYFGVYYFRK